MRAEKQFQIPADAGGRRLDAYLTDRFPDFSRGRIQRLIKAKEVRVNGRPRKPAYILSPADRVEIRLPSPHWGEPEEEDIPLRIIYEDSAIILIDKPPGLLVHPVREGQGGTLVNALLAHSERLSSIGGGLRPGIVHRLDRDTSGLLIVAKTNPAHRELSRQFKAREVDKEYRAITRGRPPAREGRIDFPIGRRRKRRVKMSVAYLQGRPALTEYRVLDFFSGGAYLRVDIMTGRTHQIRVHLARIGCPVLGDRKYGRKIDLPGPFIKVSRQMLHAHRIEFSHPETGRRMNFTAPLPADMRTVLRQLREQRKS